MTSVSNATSFTAAADPTLLKLIRSYVRTVARSLGTDADSIDDFELVASELASNVIEHTSATDVTVSFRSEHDWWILEVSGAEDLGQPGALPADQPPHTALEGRGLFITHALMDTVGLVDINDRRYVRCTKAA